MLAFIIVAGLNIFCFHFIYYFIIVAPLGGLFYNSGFIVMQFSMCLIWIDLILEGFPDN